MRNKKVLRSAVMAVMAMLAVVATGCKKDPVAGGFSVAPGKQVTLAKGNLQYAIATQSWQFADEPHFYVGGGNSQISDPNYGGYIDLFGWGTGDNPRQLSANAEDYQTFTDWGSKMGGGWRTLSKDEWKYLIEGRPNAEDRFGFATVMGVVGVVLLPDLWTTPDSLKFFPGNRYLDSNSYNKAMWDKMDAAGAIFLPESGYRVGTSYTEMYNGRYWSSTSDFSNGAWGLAIFTGGMRVNCYDRRDVGFAVRLAKDM